MSTVPIHPAAGPPRRAPIALQLVAAAATVVLLLVGLWVFASPLSAAIADAINVSRYWSSIAFAVIWFVLASFAIGKVRKHRPEFNWSLRGAFLVTALTAAGIGAWTTLRDNTVNEKVDVAQVKASQLQSQRAPAAPTAEPTPPKPMNVELSSGSFSGIDHDAKGMARVIKLAKGGRRLVLSPFAVSNAPDLRLYVTVDPVHGGVGEHKEIAHLKGNKGNQQYTLPDSLDLRRYDNVVIWCKAFDVGVAQAPLKAS